MSIKVSGLVLCKETIGRNPEGVPRGGPQRGNLDRWGPFSSGSLSRLWLCFAFQMLLFAKFQLVCKIFAAQPSPKTRHLHSMLVHREERSWVTSRTNEVLQGRGKNKERNGVVPGTADARGWETGQLAEIPLCCSLSTVQLLKCHPRTPQQLACRQTNAQRLHILACLGATVES